ncbi:MAG: TonB-dependent receptor plug domain-containing protein, partial [Polyangiaceae bacterium]|nr:TonB-dependent receptor plug domain-containing protein [Polyangiaceae bacterium]
MLGDSAASDEPILEVTADVDAPISAAHGEDPTVSGTSLSIRDRVFAGEELADVLPEVPGVRLTSTGGPGQFVGVRIRGGSYQQTTVLLGDLPISSPDSTFDLSLVPIWAVERLEVYRGDAPVWLGNGSIGGVLRLVPRRARGDEANVRVGAASFGTYQVMGGLSAASSRVSTVAAIGLAGTRGDYPFAYDSTPLVPGDEETRRRQNGENVRGSVLLGGTVELDAGTLETLLLLVGRRGGSIGSGLHPAIHTHAVDRQLWSATSFLRKGSLSRGRAYRVQARVGLGVQHSEFFDPLGEIGFSPNATDDRVLSTDARLAGAIDLAP